MIPGPLAILADDVLIAWALVANTWWLWLPFALFFAFKALWEYYLRHRYFAALEWMTLEVRLPRLIPKTPEAMEQVFAGLQTMYYGFDPRERWWEGLQHDYLVFELVSFGGDTRFFIRAPIFYKNVVEAQIYAQYPEAEISEVEDYMARLPDSSMVPSEEWDLFGLEFKLAKPDCYPIKTYRELVKAGQEETEMVDPFSSMAELFGKIHPGEYMGYHLLVRPEQVEEKGSYIAAGEREVAKLIGKKMDPERGRIGTALAPLDPVIKGWHEPLKPLFGLAPSEAEPSKRDDSGHTLMQHLSPGTKDMVESIERKVAKPGWEAIIRFCYVARRDTFHLSHLSSFIGALKTYNTLHCNAIVLNAAKAMATASPWWWLNSWKRRHAAYKKNLFYRYFRARKPFTDTPYLRSKIIILNAEELATIYHFPGMTAKAPMMSRIEARRAEPPATLPVG